MDFINACKNDNWEYVEFVLNKKTLSYDDILKGFYVANEHHSNNVLYTITKSKILCWIDVYETTINNCFNITWDGIRFEYWELTYHIYKESQKDIFKYVCRWNYELCLYIIKDPRIYVEEGLKIIAEYKHIDLLNVVKHIIEFGTKLDLEYLDYVESTF